MNKLKSIILAFAALTGLNSCNLFLEMPKVTGNVYLDEVFSNRKDAEGMLWRSYHLALRDGLPEGWGINHGTLASLSGELTRGYSWHAGYNLVVNGPHTGEDQGCPANYDQGWEVIRACWIIIDNIGKVDELSSEMKEYMRGEAYALIAYRYMGMFYRWGGVPVVRQANEMSDDLNFPRATAQETLDFTLEIIDEAYSRLPDTWTDIEPGSGEKWTGRLTKGAALAMKARLLTFAARPLFNSQKPYTEEFGLRFSGNKEMIWLGGYDEQRYRDAIDANLAVLDWAKQNNKHLIFTAGEGNRNTFEDAIKDYGQGVSQLNGPEILLAFKVASDQTTYNNMNEGYNFSNYVYAGERSQRGLLTNFVRLYRDKDGGEIDWPEAGKETAPRPISNFGENIDKIEARFRVDICVPGKYGRSNDGDANWNENIWYMGSFTSDKEIESNMARATEGRGIGVPTKFYYGAGSRVWLEFPLFRLAENYLHLAEAYNETGDAVNALKYLNIIRNRAGLPSLTETGKNALRREIQREKALEYFEENHRYYDVKHWKHPDIGTKILGGDMTEISFYREGEQNTMEALKTYWDAYSYTGYWHPKWFLEPFRQSEVNKGIIVQNPGY
ncbi:MAG: RagB/SusD family nutrient uptake outer membrane protein [Bacteroidales bacterium]|nr:RagB/SusD family nutrient uptake outer membrane protein [Bacteroidales bacterium]